jgi:hypothetical protein
VAGRSRGYPRGVNVSVDIEVEPPARDPAAVLLDKPYLRDVFERDYADPHSKPEKAGWEPRDSRMISSQWYGAKLNETRPDRCADDDCDEE